MLAMLSKAISLNGTVMSLVAEGILFRPGALGYAERFPFNIAPWAWDYLDKNRDLLGVSQIRS